MIIARQYLELGNALQCLDILGRSSAPARLGGKNYSAPFQSGAVWARSPAL